MDVIIKSIFGNSDDCTKELKVFSIEVSELCDDQGIRSFPLLKYKIDNLEGNGFTVDLEQRIESSNNLLWHLIARPPIEKS